MQSDAHIDDRRLVLVVCASQLVTLGQHGAASGLREAGCAACGFVCVPLGACPLQTELGVNIIDVGCEIDSHNTKYRACILLSMRTIRGMHQFDH